ncbi:PREDICTED: upstream activation factor subunit UAF30 [Tarenaya hassleriana]|uniref:upstream activation factor subunit UAF30 n=1 Tax=Tarenaya hassleriana TaxID=28532 RepID=UPI00053C3D43|nr:PREDICTED: upstream activation factor subunit UAF30 [Tarenaya hassleriana]
MAATSRVFGACRTLMAKAASSSATSTGAGSAKEGKGILKAVPVSQQLASFLGTNEASRTTAVKKIWEHIKLHNLQNPANKREINCDEKLKTIFEGKDKVGFLEIAKLLSRHFPKSG